MIAATEKSSKNSPAISKVDDFPLIEDPEEQIYTKEEVNEVIYDVTSPRALTSDILGFDFIRELRTEKENTKCSIDVKSVIRESILSKAAIRNSARKEAGNVKREDFISYTDIGNFELNNRPF